MPGHDDIGGDHDPLTQKIHEVLDQVIESQQAMLGVVEIVKRLGSTTQRVQIETRGMGAWGAAAVTACLMTFLGLIMFAVLIVPEIHDLRAWQDIMRQKVARLEAQLAPAPQPRSK